MAKARGGAASLQLIDMSRHCIKKCFCNDVHRFLYNLKRKQFLKKEVYDRIRPISTLTPTLYGLPKLHTRSMPMSANLSIKC